MHDITLKLIIIFILVELILEIKCYTIIISNCTINFLHFLFVCYRKILTKEQFLLSINLHSYNSLHQTLENKALENLAKKAKSLLETIGSAENSRATEYVRE